MNTPSLIHESNAIPGLTTRMLSDVVDKVVVAFPGLEAQYKRPERVTFKGTPVLVEKRERSGEGNGKKREKPLIVSFWGSLGAERLNEMMPEFIKLMVEDGKYRLIHAAGNHEELEKIKKALRQLGLPEVQLPEIEIRDYIDNMPDILPTANLVLCRAGGSTIAELAELQKPAVLIPSPHVSNNEQAENAKSFVKMGGAVSISEENCTGAVLYETVSAILAVDDKLKKMSEALKTANVSNAALSIAELAVGLVKTSSLKKKG
jgi:UDP-N-acetylglucosamine--N-acetylmuramyl-(pentapeptide) pyrophosphoryl-undecaprenol N-acetylglucosamine transferase